MYNHSIAGKWQKFALKICSKHCNVGYSALLDMVHVYPAWRKDAFT